ncbi:DUF452 family protein [Actinobacillus pleuropneumoniae]|uniref:Dithiobiotin synthetase n=1 Tax=Actinobacillus pleuropneumoniae serovar 6 str. Femo TaxID=754256 RepID=A0A828Q4T8_ACTPL|nr:pimeloyl-ACP methyl esterase BioG family protein [Actinobacillus pleuropneumoniae]EFL79922.1 hypothetical protein APP6_0591 [Actinobacillus pleuropneumoniae serovar 6 str. Femo]EFM91989.1 Dithiobiotin synthetase [Actinobacillus pleuropneumoniae serovar 6 str. Femo]UKH13527.1 DUF452 family protein [Actinobacillus pleuropneumoniae serovar 6 str. Femo]UKH24620.1 DUF452 family protein [Actinobacillus pleuropneumoniae]SUU64036.1 Uncharacterized protein conserved in bacteria [Actinobacillus pleur
MKTKLISTQQANLIIYFAGWGTPASVVSHLALPNGYDLLICYDYQDLNFPAFDFSRYQTVRLVAWSMGVWVAEKVLPEINLASATAINGTLFPKHDLWGIPLQIFDGTLQTLNAENRLKFERRMCGDKQLLNVYLALPEQRSLAEIHHEIEVLNTAIEANLVTPKLHWTNVIIGEKDRIFSAQNQLAFWQDKKVRMTHLSKGEHYLWQHFSEWEQLWQS